MARVRSAADEAHLDDRQHLRHEEPGGDALHDAGGDQHRRGRRRAAHRAGHREEGDAEEEEAAVAVVVAQPGPGDQHHRVGERVAGDDQLERAGARVQPILDVRRGDVDDEDVEDRHEAAGEEHARGTATGRGSRSPRSGVGAEGARRADRRRRGAPNLPAYTTVRTWMKRSCPNRLRHRHVRRRRPGTDAAPVLRGRARHAARRHLVRGATCGARPRSTATPSSAWPTGPALAFFQFADAADRAELGASTPASLNHVASPSTPPGRPHPPARGPRRPYRIVDHGYCR